MINDLFLLMQNINIYTTGCPNINVLKPHMKNVH